MSSEPVDGRQSELELDSDNTVSLLPGPMAGVACPACFKDTLLKGVIAGGECNSCGVELELTLTAEPE